MSPNLIAVTGATGQLGGRVARRLADAGAKTLLLVRDPSRAPALPGATAVVADYERPDGIRSGLDGAETLFLVSAPESPQRVARHAGVVDAAVEAGVKRIVYVSFLGAGPHCTFTFGRDHWHTEQHIRGTGVAFTFLRDSLYLDVVPYFPDDAGVIRGPAGDGRVAAVARDDIADVAAAVLLAAAVADGSGHDGQSYDLTGPRALSLAEVAEELTRAAGRLISYHAETLAEAYASRAGFGAPDWKVAGWVTSYAAIGAGELDVVTDTVARVAGHPPLGLRDYLAANPSVLDRLRPG